MTVQINDKVIDLVRADLEAEVEQLRVQLAACGVAAMQNTASSRSLRVVRGSYGYSESYADVCRAVDREIELREENAKLKEVLERVCVTCDWHGDDGRDAMQAARAVLGETND